jgi:hypothetical protein
LEYGFHAQVDLGLIEARVMHICELALPNANTIRPTLQPQLVSIKSGYRSPRIRPILFISIYPLQNIDADTM